VRFLDFFRDPEFMTFSDGVLTLAEAHDRFDHMVALCAEVPFAKQPIVEFSSGQIVGYTGVDRIDLEGRSWLEWGYRLIPGARGRGYATEAGRLLMARAARTHTGELLAIIHAENEPSQNVCRKLGFTFWKVGVVYGEPRNLYRLRLD
jgi:RimJ/RimL family protein N-acetyltransferase